MHTIQRLRTITSTAIVLCLMLLARVGAQTPLALADMASVLGTWTITFETAQGIFDRTLVVERRNNQVVGELKDWGNFHFEPTSDIRKSEEGIAFRFAASYSGQAFQAVVTFALYSDGKAKVTFDANEGQTVMTGEGARKN